MNGATGREMVAEQDRRREGWRQANAATRGRFWLAVQQRRHKRSRDCAAASSRSEDLVFFLDHTSTADVSRSETGPILSASTVCG